MTRRTAPTNCQQEPPYPDHETVCMSMRYPDMTCHEPSAGCGIQEPHMITECGLFSLSFMSTYLD